MDIIVKQMNKREFYIKQDFLNRNFIRKTRVIMPYANIYTTFSDREMWQFPDGRLIIWGDLPKYDVDLTRGRNITYHTYNVVIPRTEDFIKAKTVLELKRQCRRRRIKNYSKLRKVQLQTLLEETRVNIIYPR